MNSTSHLEKCRSYPGNFNRYEISVKFTYGIYKWERKEKEQEIRDTIDKMIDNNYRYIGYLVGGDTVTEFSIRQLNESS